MDDKYWNDNNEFWDEGADDDDDDDYNDFGNDNIDANNDETFDNAAEWNEDEHEEMIARDSILSQTTHRSKNNRNNSGSERIANNNNHHQQASMLNDIHVNRANNVPNTIQNTNDLDELLRNTLANHNNGISAATASSSTGARNNMIPGAFIADTLGMAGSSGGGASSNARHLLSSRLDAGQFAALNECLPMNEIIRVDAAWPNLDTSEWGDSRPKPWDKRKLEETQHAINNIMMEMNSPELKMQQQLHNLRRVARLEDHERTARQEAHEQAVRREAHERAFRQEAAPPRIMTVDELEKQFIKTNINQQNSQHQRQQNQEAKPQPIGTPSQSQPPPPHQQQQQQLQRNAVWSPFAKNDLFDADKSKIVAQGDLGPQIQLPPMSIEQECILLTHQIKQWQQQMQQSAILEQQQQQQQQQQHLLQQQQLLQHQNRLQQLLESRSAAAAAEAAAPHKPQCLTVEELERQMMADRVNRVEEKKTTLNNNTNADYPSIEHSLINLIQQKSVTNQPIIGSEQHDQSQSTSGLGRPTNKQNLHTNEHQHQQQQHQQQQQQHQPQQQQQQQRHKRYGERLEQSSTNNNRHREYQNRDNHRQERNGGRTTNDNYGNRRDNRRDHYRHYKRETTIIPPQVQLSVIEKIKSMNLSQADEFLVDRMPNAEGSIQSKRHSMNTNVKSRHDGILTEQERSWLTKVQKKIQSECDENLDQDYYYLLYFNRTSMTDEAANKPSGPGCLDKRFIPRERLLYNNSAV